MRSPEDFLRDIQDYISRLDINAPLDLVLGNRPQQHIIDTWTAWFAPAISRDH